jgi:hypothetical protein
MEIRHGSRRIPVNRVPNPGTGNNCLGYALGPMLKCDPEDLRASLVDFVRDCADHDTQMDLACSVLDDFEKVPEAERVGAAIRELEGGCFIPADIFVAYCAQGKDRRRTLMRHNVVFFAERQGYWEPVTYHLDDVARLTQYVGCNRSNTHYEALAMGARHQLQFDVAFFGV